VYLLLVMHHIAFDGESMPILMRDLNVLMQAIAAQVDDATDAGDGDGGLTAASDAIAGGVTPASASALSSWPALHRLAIARALAHLPPLPLNYIDYSMYEHEWLYLQPTMIDAPTAAATATASALTVRDATAAAADSSVESSRRFWRSHLEGAYSYVQRVPSGQVVQAQSSRARVHVLEFPSSLVSRLESAASEAGCSLYVLLLSSVMSFFHRWLGDSEVLLGGVTANRYREELQPLVGMFVNTLVYRARFDAEEDRNLTFNQLLARMHTQAMEVLQHSHLPFQEVLAMHRPGASDGGAGAASAGARRFFQTMVTLTSEPLEGDSRQMNHLSLSGGAGEFDLCEDLYAPDMFDLSLSFVYGRGSTETVSQPHPPSSVSDASAGVPPRRCPSALRLVASASPSSAWASDRLEQLRARYEAWMHALFP